MNAISIVMGSSSDWETLSQAAVVLDDFEISFDRQVLSAHRMPDDMFRFAETAAGRGVKAIIAGAGGAAHLPGMLAAKTTVPVLGVPVASRFLQGMDSLYSIVQMPKGVPVATVAIGNAFNAGILATQILAFGGSGVRPELVKQLESYKAYLRDYVLSQQLPQ